MLKRLPNWLLLLTIRPHLNFAGLQTIMAAFSMSQNMTSAKKSSMLSLKKFGPAKISLRQLASIALSSAVVAQEVLFLRRHQVSLQKFNAALMLLWMLTMAEFAIRTGTG